MMPGTARPFRTALLVAAFSAVVVAASFAWRYYARPVLYLGPMVQQVSTDSFALFCGTSGTEQVLASLYEQGRLKRAGTVVPQGKGRFIITFSGLDPSRAYEYEILSSDEIRLARHTVRTAPADQRAFRFVALGDTGVGDRHQNNVARQMRDYRPDLILHTGDLIYPLGVLEEHHRKFFQPYRELLAEVPLYVCLGNHEYRMPGIDPLAEAFVFPPNGPTDAPPERNYWFDYSSARFIAIDSNNDYPFFRDTIVPWLDEVMRSAGDRWKILFFHEPVHTNGKYPPAEKLLMSIVPVLESHGADLVLHGHNHMYERTHPVRGGKVVEQGILAGDSSLSSHDSNRSNVKGTMYVTTGAGGANLAEARLPMPETIAAWNDRDHSFTVVDVSTDVLHLRQISESGRLIDECHIHRD